MELSSEFLKDFHSKMINSQILKISLPNKADLQTFKDFSGFGQKNCNGITVCLSGYCLFTLFGRLRLFHHGNYKRPRTCFLQ